MGIVEFNIITLFPELFDGFQKTSLIGKAIKRNLLSINFIDLRDFTHDRHRSVDDTPYGGGSGMVMRPGPIHEALLVLPKSHKILLTPQGKLFSQSLAKSLVARAPLTLFCGRYEGVDERVRPLFDEEVSLGDFVLNGGEVAAMAIIESVSRLIPGVLGNVNSVVEESFSDGLLEYPQYTRPEVFYGASVPEVLLSGDHGRIARWRRAQSLARTKLNRPDLWRKYSKKDDDDELLKEFENAHPTKTR